jgi:uracil-DNA glycosylase
MKACSIKAISSHLADVQACRQCAKMIGPVITPQPVVTRVYLCGQAPGPREGTFGRPFAWTAGKTLFQWFESLGVDEQTFRSGAYIGAVCRCFPGKTNQGGDRVPSPEEIENCSRWMKREFDLLHPNLVIAVGRLAIEQFLPAAPLAEVVGRQFRIEAFGHVCDLIPLPHPSGASTWFKMEPGRTLLKGALKLLKAHPEWKRLSKRPE